MFLKIKSVIIFAMASRLLGTYHSSGKSKRILSVEFACSEKGVLALAKSVRKITFHTIATKKGACISNEESDGVYAMTFMRGERSHLLVALAGKACVAYVVDSDALVYVSRTEIDLVCTSAVHISKSNSLLFVNSSGFVSVWKMTEPCNKLAFLRSTQTKPNQFGYYTRRSSLSDDERLLLQVSMTGFRLLAFPDGMENSKPVVLHTHETESSNFCRFHATLHGSTVVVFTQGRVKFFKGVDASALQIEETPFTYTSENRLCSWRPDAMLLCNNAIPPSGYIFSLRTRSKLCDIVAHECRFSPTGTHVLARVRDRVNVHLAVPWSDRIHHQFSHLFRRAVFKLMCCKQVLESEKTRRRKPVMALPRLPMTAWLLIFEFFEQVFV